MEDIVALMDARAQAGGRPVTYQLRALAGQKGLTAERHHWRRRVRLVCPNGVALRFPRDGHRWSGWEPGHAWRYLQGLPDVY